MQPMDEKVPGTVGGTSAMWPLVLSAMTAPAVAPPQALPSSVEVTTPSGATVAAQGPTPEAAAKAAVEAATQAEKKTQGKNKPQQAPPIGDTESAQSYLNRELRKRYQEVSLADPKTIYAEEMATNLPIWQKVYGVEGVGPHRPLLPESVNRFLRPIAPILQTAFDTALLLRPRPSQSAQELMGVTQRDPAEVYFAYKQHFAQQQKDIADRQTAALAQAHKSAMEAVSRRAGPDAAIKLLNELRESEESGSEQRYKRAQLEKLEAETEKIRAETPGPGQIEQKQLSERLKIAKDQADLLTTMANVAPEDGFQLTNEIIKSLGLDKIGITSDYRVKKAENGRDTIITSPTKGGAVNAYTINPKTHEVNVIPLPGAYRRPGGPGTPQPLLTETYLLRKAVEKVMGDEEGFTPGVKTKSGKRVWSRKAQDGRVESVIEQGGLLPQNYQKRIDKEFERLKRTRTYPGSEPPIEPQVVHPEQEEQSSLSSPFDNIPSHALARAASLIEAGAVSGTPLGQLFDSAAPDVQEVMRLARLYPDTFAALVT
jgi:hypothetical protein